MIRQKSPAGRVAEPVGHDGARVAIQERPAVMVSGWLGVLVLLACAAAVVVAVQDQAGGRVIAPPRTLVGVPADETALGERTGTEPRRSWRARSAWRSWHSPGCKRRAWWSSTRNGRRR